MQDKCRPPIQTAPLHKDCCKDPNIAALKDKVFLREFMDLTEVCVALGDPVCSSLISHTHTHTLLGPVSKVISKVTVRIAPLRGLVIPTIILLTRSLLGLRAAVPAGMP